MNPNAWRLAAAVVSRTKTGAELLLIGDSIAAAFPQLMAARAFGRKTVCNLGVNGLRTQNVLWLLDLMATQQLQPLDVMLLIGTNNLSAADKPCAIAAGTRRIIERVKELWAPQRMVLVQTVPRAPGKDLRALDRLELHRLMELHVPNDSNLTIVNADAVLSGERRAYHTDGMHLLPFGYGLITDVVCNALEVYR